MEATEIKDTTIKNSNSVKFEKREKLERIKAAGQLPCQRQEHLIGNFVQPRPLPSLQDPPVVKYGEGVLLHAPEIVDLSYLFENNRGCLDEPKPWGPRQYGLVVAATASVLDVRNGVEGIKDGCPVACSPERRPMLRNVFTIRSANAVPSDGEVVGLGQEFFLENIIKEEEVSNVEGVMGCLLTDKSGLCLGVKGNAVSDSAGVIAAMAELVGKIEPGSKPPIISLQSETRQCLIHQQGPVIGAIFKDTSA